MNVFPTEQEAIDAQAIDLSRHLTHHRDIDFNKEWEDGTICWDAVKKRTDAEEWFYKVCPNGVQTHTQKEAQESWYPATEV